jgi:hypothetical protein
MHNLRLAGVTLAEFTSSMKRFGRISCFGRSTAFNLVWLTGLGANLERLVKVKGTYDPRISSPSPSPSLFICEQVLDARTSASLAHPRFGARPKSPLPSDRSQAIDGTVRFASSAAPLVYASAARRPQCLRRTAVLCVTFELRQ